MANYKLKNNNTIDSTGIMHRDVIASSLLDLIYNKRASYHMSAQKGWKRIAALEGMAGGHITIQNATSYGTIGEIIVQYLQGYDAGITKVYKRVTNGDLFTKARVVYSGNQQGYVEIYQDLEYDRDFQIFITPGSLGIYPITRESSGSVPAGFNSKEIDF